ncbi:EGF-like domain-containing protein [Tieghemostelium lacteum]|uniref:EGF-like domain-containing protein n=1 Tax=Tieghemostelium lacteum TaxID=361077 RepID=A0A151ZIA1_TIELA|nr:EGF-like domain-containing protein [Tieghemostelium lacteum]|eukprot:KYQ93693.1 EGF-like domain-containing protein [Tieghemostelium lacteum]
MKFESLVLLIVSLVFIQISLVNSWGTPVTFLGHTYQIILWNETTINADWSSAYQDAINRGGYMATFLKQAESSFVINSFNLTTNLLRPFIGGNSLATYGKKFYWEAGPEKGELFYDRDMNKGYLYNNWSPNQPDRANPQTGQGTEFYVNLHPAMWNDYQINASAVLGYVLETGGENDPYMSSLETDSIEIVFKNVKGFQRNGITINVVSVSGNKASFQCPFKKWLSDTSFSCYKHYTMSGQYNITIADGVRTPFTIELVHPNMPYVSAVVPPTNMVTGGIFTINGASFSDNISELTVLISSTLVPCNPTAYILPHRSFTCTLAADLTANVAQITVGVNGIVLERRTRIPFYNQLTGHLVIQGGNFFWEPYMTYNYEGKGAVPFTPLDDYVLLGLLENTPQCFNTTYDSATTSYILADSPKAGQAVVTISGSPSVATCQKTVFAGCGSLVDPNVTSSRTAPLGWLNSKPWFVSPITTSCKLSYLFDLPNFNPYFTENPKAYLISTYGGLIYVPVTGLRLTSSKYEMYQGSSKFTQYLSPNWEFMALEVNIPPGTGTHFMENGFLTVSVDGKSSGLSQSYIGYLPPTINTTTANPPTNGTLLTVFGDSFGADPSKISITVTFQTTGQQSTFSPNILVPHQQLTFNLIPGSGYFSVKVNVDGQNSTYHSNYHIPVINNHIQNQKLITLSVDNSLVNYVQSMMSLTLNSITIPLVYNNYTSISFTLPDDAYDGPLILTVDGLPSEIYNLTLVPILNDIQWVGSGNETQLTGHFLYQPDSITIGGVQCASISVTFSQSISCTPTGTGINLNTIVKLGNGFSSNTVLFSYQAVIDTATNPSGQETLEINGNNFNQDSIINIQNADGTFTIITPSNIDLDFQNATIPLTQKNTFVSVTTNGMTSNLKEFKLTPFVTSITSISTLGGEVTILGNYLNVDNVKGITVPVLVKIGPTIQCQSPKLALPTDNQKLLCQVPPGTGSNLNVTVSVDGIVSNSNIQFSFGKPSIATAFQNPLNLKQLIITGNNFGTEISDIIVKLNQDSVPLNCIFNQSNLNCDLLQSSSGGYVSLQVVDQQSDNYNLELTPIIVSVDPVASTATSITINGWFLRSNAIITDYTGEIGGVQCNTINSYAAQDYVICALSDNSVLVSNHTPSVIVSVQSKPSNSLPVQYSTPTIALVVQIGRNMKIQGNTFGNLDSLPAITYGSETLNGCTFTTIQSEISCPIPVTSVNGLVTLSVYQGQDDFQLNLTPILESVAYTLTSGGVTNITGVYLNDIFSGVIPLSIVSIPFATSTCDNIQLDTVNNVIHCQVPGGLPAIVLFRIDISGSFGIQSNSLRFEYLPPSVLHYSQSQFILTLTGESFGLTSYASTLSVHGYPSPINCEIIVNHVTITCDIEYAESQLLNGEAKVSSNTDTSEAFTLNFTPILIESTKAQTKGGLITVTGHFLSLKNSNSQNNIISVSTNLGDAIADKSLSSNSMIVKVPSGAHGIENQLKLTINGKESNNISFSAENPSLVDTYTNGKLYYPGDGGYVTIVGTNFILNNNDLVQVTIGGNQCEQPNVISDTQLICHYKDLVKPVDQFGLGVVVTCDGLSSDEMFLFLYDSNSASCQGTPQCSGNGNCFNGRCLCTGNFTGQSCEIDGNTSTPQQPGTVDPDGAKFSNFSVFFTHIREVEATTKKVVLIYPVSELKWNVTKNSTTQLQSVGIINGTSIKVQVNTTLFLKPETIHFAGDILQMTANSLKYQLSIEQWPFTSKFNTLEIIYAMQSPQSEQICKETLSSNQTIDNQDDIRTITVQLNGQVFISQFSKRIYSDGRVTTTSTKLLDKSDSIYQTPFYQNQQNLTVVSLTTPHFQNSTIIDPSFQLLLQSNLQKTTSDTCSQTESKKSLWWISLIVVGAAGGTAAAIGTIIYKKKQAKVSKYESSLRSIN